MSALAWIGPGVPAVVGTAGADLGGRDDAVDDRPATIEDVVGCADNAGEEEGEEGGDDSTGADDDAGSGLIPAAAAGTFG